MNPDPRTIADALRRWFAADARDLPWRCAPAGSRPLYPVLLSEFMLHQTQVARVLIAYPRFLARFPTLADLARAGDDEVLAAWTGLGYYRRARLLHACARALVERHDGTLPPDPAAVRALPGVGAYTAGALLSLCHDLPVPAIDTNVRRVLSRLHAAASMSTTQAEHAARTLHADAPPDTPRAGSGLLNEALIELGALICTPRSPACERCCLRASCRACAAGDPTAFGRPAPSRPRTTMHCATVVIRSRRGVLIEPRPRQGLWAGLWQAPTLEDRGRPITTHRLRSALPVQSLHPVDAFEFQTTHRTLRFRVYEASPRPHARLAVAPRRWASRRELERLPISSPQRRILLGLSSP